MGDLKQLIAHPRALVPEYEGYRAGQSHLVKAFFRTQYACNHLAPECPRNFCQVGTFVDSNKKMSAHGGTKRLRRPGVGTAVGKIHIARTRGGGGTQYRADVARILYGFKQYP